MKYALITIVFLLVTAEATASEKILTGRYSYVVNTPTNEQIDPLKVVIKTKIPQRMSTVGHAVKFLLLRSGYELADTSVMTDSVKKLLAKPLPSVHREIGPLTLDKSLQMLSGKAFVLLVDPVNRKVSYKVASSLNDGESNE